MEGKDYLSKSFLCDAAKTLPAVSVAGKCFVNYVRCDGVIDVPV